MSEEKFYSISYKNGKVERECMSHNKKIPDLLIFKQEVIGDFNIYFVQYTLKHTDLTNKYLKMMGLLFFKKTTVNYSLDLVNINNTNDMEIHFVDYDNNNRIVVEKIERYQGNDEIVYHMVELLSHESVAKIFD